MKNSKRYDELRVMIEKKKEQMMLLLDEDILNSPKNLELSQEIDELIVELYKEMDLQDFEP